MAIEQDPKRLSRADVIAYVSLAVGLLSLAVGVISYIRPPDPSHPLRFDFLLQRVSFPLWGTILGVIAIAGGAYGIGVRKARKSSIAPLPIEKPSAKSIAPANSSPTMTQPAEKPIAKATPSPTTSRIVSQGREEFALETPDHYTVRIRRHRDQTLNGLVMSVDNNRLEAITKVSLTIFTVQSFSARHGQFREPFGFSAARMLYQGNIGAESSGMRFWILRKDDAKLYLLAGDDHTHLMAWPNGDPVETQKWRMRLQLKCETVPTNAGTPAKAFSTQPFNVIVNWNSVTNEFFIEQEPSEPKP